ncbi:MAG: hypothetical protein WBB28_18185 [Crinalium sp.]
MHILNQASGSFHSPISITAYVGFISKEQKTVLHPGLEERLREMNRDMEYKEYEQKENQIKLDPRNYVQAVLYEAGLTYVPEYLSKPNTNFRRVRCDKNLYSEQEVLEQLWVMTKEKPTILVQVTALIEEVGYESRINSSLGYGQFVLANIRIGSQHKEQRDFNG